MTNNAGKLSNISQKEADLKADIVRQTAKINWFELERFFASGQLWFIKDDMDLVEVATALANDDKYQVSTWLSSGQLSKVQDEQAAQWQASAQVLWAVVVSPWVVVQLPTQAHP